MACLSANASLTEVPEKLSREQLVVEINNLERIIEEVEPKVDWFRTDAERKVWEGPFTQEAEQAASLYGNLLIGLSNARARLSRMKRELMEYDIQ